jgi:hypothetical protein
MEICSSNHDEVCFEGFVCPVCRMQEEMQEKIDKLQSELDVYQIRDEERRERES